MSGTTHISRLSTAAFAPAGRQPTDGVRAPEILRHCSFPSHRVGHDNTLGLLTQNVQSLGRRHGRRNAWFSHFRQRQEYGDTDLVCVHETCTDQSDIDDAQAYHLRSWGFASAEEGKMLSAWSACSLPNTGRSGGVCIFIRPYSSVLNLHPYRESD